MTAKHGTYLCGSKAITYAFEMRRWKKQYGWQNDEQNKYGKKRQKGEERSNEAS
jgi:hypothetical protein